MVPALQKPFGATSDDAPICPGVFPSEIFYFMFQGKYADLEQLFLNLPSKSVGDYSNILTRN